MDNYAMSRGVAPGLIGGYIFLAYIGAGMVPTGVGEDGALIMQMGNGMIDFVGGMIGAGAFIGFVIHIIVSVVIGALYTGVFLQYVDLGNPFMNIVVGGAIYGLIWWIIGGNIIMPAVAGGEVLQLSIGPSFYGHIMFGHVLAFLVVLRDRAIGFEDFMLVGDVSGGESMHVLKQTGRQFVDVGQSLTASLAEKAQTTVKEKSPAFNAENSGEIRVYAEWRGHSFEATLDFDELYLPGSRISFMGVSETPNNAALKAVNTVKPDSKIVNGWAFWKLREPNGDKGRPIEDLLTDNALVRRVLRVR